MNNLLTVYYLQYKKSFIIQYIALTITRNKFSTKNIIAAANKYKIINHLLFTIIPSRTYILYYEKNTQDVILHPEHLPDYLVVGLINICVQ